MAPGQSRRTPWLQAVCHWDMMRYHMGSFHGCRRCLMDGAQLPSRQGPFFIPSR